MINPYRVEKHSAAARLLLIDGDTLSGRLFLAPSSPSHGGSQNPAELMEEPGSVLPLRGDDGRLLLVGRAVVAAVGVAAEAGEGTDLVVRVPARVRLLGGHALDGALLGEAGMGGRASDLFNAPGEWIRFEGPDAVYWLAKRHLVVLEPRDA